MGRRSPKPPGKATSRTLQVPDDQIDLPAHVIADRPLQPLKPPAIGAGKTIFVVDELKVLRVSLRSASFEERVDLMVEGGHAREGSVQTAVAVNARVALFDIGAELLLGVLVRPDPAHVPVEIRLTMSVLVGRPEGMDDATLVRQTGKSGPRILMPYVRQMIASLTTHTVFGPLSVVLHDVQLSWD